MTTPTRLTFLKNELVDLSFTATCSPAAHASFPLSNLYDNRPGPVFKFGSTAFNCYVLFDFGSSPQSFNAIGLVNHLLPSSGWTVKIQANATDVWTAPSIDQTITYHQYNTCKVFTNTTSYRYWRLRLQESDGFIVDNDALTVPGAGIIGTTPLGGGSGSGAGYQVSIGELVLGGVVEAPANPIYSQSEAVEYPNVRVSTDFGDDFCYAYQSVFGAEYRWTEAMLSDTQLTTFRTLFDNRRGAALPVLVIPDPGGTLWHASTAATECYFGRLGQKHDTRKTWYNANELALAFREIPNGRFLT